MYLLLSIILKEMKVSQSFSYTGSSVYDISADYDQAGKPIFFDKDGFEGIDYMPYEGSTVKVYSNVLGTPGDEDFSPSLNNKLYWLVTNDLLVDREDIISQATPISVSLVSGRYEGSFTFTNPDGFDRLYLISDYTNNIPVGGSITSDFSVGTQVIDVAIENQEGVVSMDYAVAAGTIRIAIEYAGNIVDDTGVIITAQSGQLSFIKTGLDNDQSYRVIIDNYSAGNTVDLSSNPISLTPVFISDVDGALDDVCSQIADKSKYHNGSGSLPVPGDIIYEDSTGLTRFNGNNSYHVVSATMMMAPSSSSVYVLVLNNGSISDSGSCTCGESSVPVITQTDITVAQNQDFSIQVEVTNNPTSWTVVSTCNEYSLEGGEKGSIFTYTDCDSVFRRATSGINSSQVVCAASTPTVVSGTGTVTNTGVCLDNSLPVGVSFKDGVITGKSSITGTKTIELIATNCVGDSTPVSFDLTVESTVNLAPVGIDIKEPSVDGVAACALSGVYEILYHTGSGDIPDINDTIYFDPKALNKFVGGKRWFKVATSLYSIQIDELGGVVDKYTC